MATDEPLAPVHEDNPDEGIDPRNHIPLVGWIARRYRHCGIPWRDLIQEGELGLMIAVRDFRWSEGIRFSTYAEYWIRNMILLAIYRKGWPVRIPIDLRKLIHRGITPDGPGLTRRQRDRLVAALVALDRGLEPYGDLPAWRPATDPGIVYRVDLIPALGEIPPRERSILERYYGLEGNQPHTYQELADEQRVTRERIAQLVNKGLSRLRIRFARGTSKKSAKSHVTLDPRRNI